MTNQKKPLRRREGREEASLGFDDTSEKKSKRVLRVRFKTMARRIASCLSDSDYSVETSANVKLFAINESHLTLSEVSMREQGQRRLQARKIVADLHWPRTDSCV